MDFQHDQGFVIVGAATGQVIASQVGVIGVVGGFGGMALGTPVIVVGGAIAGAAIQGLLEGIETGDVKILGVTTVGSVVGAGFSAVVGKVGVSVAGSAFSIGMGTMAAAGGLLALGVYQLLKMFSGKASVGKYYENLLFLEQITKEYKEERKWQNLEIEADLQLLEKELANNIQYNELNDYQWQSLDSEWELESLKQQLKTCLQNTNSITQVLYDPNETESSQMITLRTSHNIWKSQEFTDFDLI